jgi:primosomal protein N' (replication factor Y)
MRRIRVAVPVPALEALTYAVPSDFPDPSIGARVLVPLGRRILTGVVVEGVRTRSDPGLTAAEGEEPPVVKDIVDVLDSETFLPADVVALAAWVAEYYACGIGEAIERTMPPKAWVESERYAQITDLGHGRLLIERGTRRALLDQLQSDKPVRVDALVGERRGAHSSLLALERDGLLTITRPLVGSASAFRTIRVATLTAQGFDVDSMQIRLGPKQREALTLLAGAPGGLATADLDGRGIAGASLKGLAALGLIAFSQKRVERDPFEDSAPQPLGDGSSAHAPAAVTLTGEQAAALERLRGLGSAGTFAAALLHGVTGSGKTEIYLRLARETVAAGKGVLLLVPEIALTPAVVAVFRALFGDRVAIQHSGLSEGERHDQWHRIRRGDVDVVVGTRSAVFAPLQRLGLIIVDEEHDSSYKQEESPRYHGRDVAVMRARSLNALVVLGSATPSLESYHNAQSGRYQLIALEKRVFDRPMAAVRLVDMRQEYAASGPDVVISDALAQAIGERLERREQAMVLLNRRGFATSVLCRQCGSTFDCPNCSVTLTVHKAARRARCHYCNYSIAVPERCARCSGQYLELTGFGTERVEA